MDWFSNIDGAALMEAATAWLNQAAALIPSLALALAVLVAFNMLAKLTRRLSMNALGRTAANPEAARLIATVAKIAVVMAGVFVALDILHLDKTVTSLLAGVGIMGLALGFAFQDLAANFMAGVLMAFNRPFLRDDVVETNGILGKVEAISLRSTLLKTFAGQRVVIPNKDVFGQPLTNYSQTGERRVDVPVGVAYDADLEHVKRVAHEAASQVQAIDHTKDIGVFVMQFGASSIDLEVRFWIRVPETNLLEVRSDVIIAIKRAFDAEGITIPYPIRSLELLDSVAAAGVLPIASVPEQAERRAG